MPETVAVLWYAVTGYREGRRDERERLAVEAEGHPPDSGEAGEDARYLT